LLPGAVKNLVDLGINLDSCHGYPFRGISFSDEESSASAKISHGTGYGVRRRTLHSLLVERASELGVVFHWGIRVTGFDTRGAFVDGAYMPCQWLVGSDGQNSCVGKWTNLNSKRPRFSRFGFSRHYAASPWSDLVEVHWGPGCQMFVTPTANDEVCVAVLSHDPQLRIDRALVHFPVIAEHLKQARPRTAELGSVTALGRARGVVRRNVALVGDASFTVDGIAGLGLSLAFEQAILAADAIAHEDLTYYETAHRKISVTPWRVTRLLLLMDQSTWVRRKVLRLFARNPAMFSRMMSAHLAQTMSETLHATEILGLGWQVLRA
jgi:menaquinone-9 beta-reductase